MLIGRTVRMLVPDASFAITPQNAVAIEYQGVADETLLDVGVDLDETVCVDMQTHFDRMLGFVYGLHFSNEDPFRCGPSHVTFYIV